jgi:hypothetical protein
VTLDREATRALLDRLETRVQRVITVLREKLDRAEALGTLVTQVRQALLETQDLRGAWDKLETLAKQVPPVVPAHAEIREILAQLGQQVMMARRDRPVQLEPEKQDPRGIQAPLDPREPE